MALLEKAVQADLVAVTRRILRLNNSDLRVTDYALICKNPNYSLCDAMLKTDVVYSVEYLLSFWEAKTQHVPCFVFKNTGRAVSLCCYVRPPVKLANCPRVREFNVLRVNESIVVGLKDIEQIKPSAQGILTNCVVRRSACGSAYNIELVAFGPDNELEYEALLRELYLKKTRAGGAWRHASPRAAAGTAVAALADATVLTAAPLGTPASEAAGAAPPACRSRRAGVCRCEPRFFDRDGNDVGAPGEGRRYAAEPAPPPPASPGAAGRRATGAASRTWPGGAAPSAAVAPSSTLLAGAPSARFGFGPWVRSPRAISSVVLAAVGLALILGGYVLGSAAPRA
ncbi:T50 [Tupaiid betaherpesvirus 1]|uniref:T50 n=1 Tax=Tupaiid herpesvirus 1 (strain 1) TaxID=10397 RepID=Q91TN8_TUHV1|nr:T50 [Tupaiid betaherpesvirus 1]AAK57099.1 T50 [Tupaiid betaherpesvirus 1]